jgi:ABC-type uncharacterized transport system fused permease/ATPase subunit
MKSIPDFIEFIVSLLILVTLSFTLLAFGFSIEALMLQLLIIVSIIGDVSLYCLHRNDD